MSAMDEFKSYEIECGDLSDETALERLRFYCSLAMNDQDWLESEVFFDDLLKEKLKEK